MWLVILTTKKYRPKLEHTKEERFQPFMRIDMDGWSFLLTPITHFFYWPRFFMGWGSITAACVLTLMSQCFIKQGSRPTGFISYMNGLILAFACMMSLNAAGVMRCRKKKVEYCYKKWLGPDWKFDKNTSFKNAGTYVANHQGFVDIFFYLFMYNPCPGFVAKSSIKNVWAIGYIADMVLNSLFTDRVDKNSKARILGQLENRQKAAIEGTARPLVIFPEGCTTNGTGLIKFKKGAFASLLPVQPHVFNYKNYFYSRV